jgi:hypothetical protein
VTAHWCPFSCTRYASAESPTTSPSEESSPDRLSESIGVVAEGTNEDEVEEEEDIGDMDVEGISTGLGALTGLGPLALLSVKPCPSTLLRSRDEGAGEAVTVVDERVRDEGMEEDWEEDMDEDRVREETADDEILVDAQAFNEEEEEEEEEEEGIAPTVGEEVSVTESDADEEEPSSKGVGVGGGAGCTWSGIEGRGA